MNVKEFYRSKNVQISKNFKSNEFACKDGSEKILIDVDLVQNELQMLRDFFDKQIIISSGYRTKSYNTKVGGAKNSYHMAGQAFDIKAALPVNYIAGCAMLFGIKGVILYQSFVHIDSRKNTYHYDNVRQRNMEKQCIMLGEISSFVKTVQKYFCINPDGIFGNETLKYVKEFQFTHGLDVDGVIGEKTFKALIKGGMKVG